MQMKGSIPFKLALTLVSTVAMLSQGAAIASEQALKIEDANIKFNVPDGWKNVKDVFGIPLVLFSPNDAEGHRATISVIASPVENAKFDTHAMEKDQKNYQQGRKDWLKGVNGKVIKFFPYEQAQWPNSHNVQSVGYEYELNNQKFIEHSYYVPCKDHLFFIKSQVVAQNDANAVNDVNQVVRSFSCE